MPSHDFGPNRPPAAPTLVGLVGKKRVGKDTVAARLVERYGFARLAFADLLRAACLGLDPIVLPAYRPVRLSELVGELGWEGAKEVPEVRRTLQRYGVAMRSVDPTIWIRPVLDAVRSTDRPVVITDVRFPNEADAVETAGGTLVRVVRPFATSDDLHISETALDDRRTALVIDNSATVNDLHILVDDLMASFASVISH